MSNPKLKVAQDLLQAKEFKAARAILETMPDDPTAQKWLTQLKEVTPAERLQWEYCEVRQHQQGDQWIVFTFFYGSDEVIRENCADPISAEVVTMSMVVELGRDGWEAFSVEGGRWRFKRPVK